MNQHSPSYYIPSFPPPKLSQFPLEFYRKTLHNLLSLSNADLELVKFLFFQQNYACTTYPKVLKHVCVREKSNHKMTQDIYDNPHLKNYCSENFDWWAILRKSQVHIEFVGHLTYYPHTNGVSKSHKFTRTRTKKIHKCETTLISPTNYLMGLS